MSREPKATTFAAVVAVLATLPVGACGPAADRAPHASRSPRVPVDGFVAYVGTNRGVRALVTESFDGRTTRAIRLTGLATDPNRPPTVSRSGRVAAVVASRRGRRDIYVLDLRRRSIDALGLPRSLGNLVDQIALSPDGSEIAFSHVRWGDCGPARTSDLGLHVVRTDGTGVRRLPALPPSAAPLRGNPTWIAELEWMPGGGRLFYQVWQGSSCETRSATLRAAQLTTVATDGGRPVAVATRSIPGRASWSPDGDAVASASQADFEDLVVTDVSSGATTVLGDGYIGGVAWTERGIYAVKLDQSVGPGIVLVDPRRRSVRAIGAGSSSASLAAPADGRYVAFVDSLDLRVYSHEGAGLLERTLEGVDGFAPPNDYDTSIVVVPAP